MVHWNNCFLNANLSLCGCGFLCIYHAGVCAALKEYAPQLTRNKIYGASAGSIAATGLICNVSIADATTAILQVVAEARSGALQAFSPTFDLMGIIQDELNRILPENAHQLCTGRLFISLTRYDNAKNILVSEFATKKELIQAILCSCFIPIFCGYSIPQFRGIKYIDGGFSDNQPTFDQNTITVSPFSGESDICPMDHASASILGFHYYNSSIRFNNENFYRFCSCFIPPSQEICSKICRQGFTDALRFLTKNSITPCHRCLSNQSLQQLNEVKYTHNYFANPFLMDITNGPTKKRKRLDSECEVCLSRLEQRLSTEMTTALFPEILQKTLQQQQPVCGSTLSRQLFNYAHTFRVVQYIIQLLNPILCSAEFIFFILKTLNDLLQKTPDTDFFLKQFHQFVDLLLYEVEERKLLCTGQNITSHQISLSSNDILKEFLPNYPFGDFDSFDVLKNQSLSHDLMLLEFYEKIPADSIFFISNPNQELMVKKTEQSLFPVQSPTILNNDIKDLTGNDSGISSCTPPQTISGITSSDNKCKIKKCDITSLQARSLIKSECNITNSRFNGINRRHTVNNTIGTMSDSTGIVLRDNGSKRHLAKNLNKSLRSMVGSKHSMLNFGSCGSQYTTISKQRQKLTTSIMTSESETDEENFFVPNRIVINNKNNNRHRHDSNRDYDGDVDPSSGN